MKHVKKGWGSLLAGAMVALIAWTAQAEAKTAAAPSTEVVPPDVMVQHTTKELQDLIRENHDAYAADLEHFYQVVDQVLVPHFDVPYIARSVLARNWRTASDEQRQAFADSFKNMLIRSYANSLLEYHDSVEAQWAPLRMAEGADETDVHCTLQRKDGQPPVELSFAVHKAKDDGQWKIYDITVENISLVQNFRGQFAAEIKRSGLDAVIAQMAAGDAARAAPAAGNAAAQ